MLSTFSNSTPENLLIYRNRINNQTQIIIKNINYIFDYYEIHKSLLELWSLFNKEKR